MSASTRACAILSILGGLCFAATAGAQTPRSGGTDNAAAQRMQQLVTERTTLQEENGKLKQQLEEVQKKFSAAEAGQSALRARVKLLQEQTAGADVSKEATAMADKLRGQLQELVAQYRDTAQNLKNVEAERGALQNRSAGLDRDLKVCVDRNQKLLALNDEVLRRFEDQGFWTAVSKKEPFTRLKRIELENLADGYRDTARDNRVEPALN